MFNFPFGGGDAVVNLNGYAIIPIEDYRNTGELYKALSTLLERYTELVNCGDCGFWDPEAEKEVITARAALTWQPQPFEPAIVDRNPEGGNAEERFRAEHESDGARSAIAETLQPIDIPSEPQP